MYVHFLNNNMKKSKTIYIGLSADGIHHGHIKLLEKARDYGEIIVGLLTDEAIATYKRIPYLKYEQREQILLNLKGVKKVVPQNKQDYSYNIKMIKPDFMIHGDDWKVGYMKEFRKNCIKALNSYGGKLIEVPYTKGISSSAFINHLDSTSITADIRRGTLRRLVESKKLSRFKNIDHAFFNRLGGKSTGIFKSLNCGMGSSDNKKNILKNLEIVGNKIKTKHRKIIQ